MKISKNVAAKILQRLYYFIYYSKFDDGSWTKIVEGELGAKAEGCSFNVQGNAKGESYLFLFWKKKQDIEIDLYFRKSGVNLFQCL